MKQLWRLQSQCRHLQEHTSGVMSVRGRHCSTCSFEATERQSHRQHTQWLEQKRFQNKNKNKQKKQTKLTTNQWLISQNNRLATHQCPQDSTTENSTLLNSTENELRLRHPRHLGAVIQWNDTQTYQALRHTSLAYILPHRNNLTCSPSRPSQPSYMLGTQHCRDWQEQT